MPNIRSVGWFTRVYPWQPSIDSSALMLEVMPVAVVEVAVYYTA